MNSTPNGSTTMATGELTPETLARVRQEVKSTLLQSEAFRALPADKQRQIAHDTVRVAGYLAEPDGIKGNQLTPATAPGAADPYALALGGDGTTSNTGDVGGIGRSQFKAQAAREGAAVAGA